MEPSDSSERRAILAPDYLRQTGAIWQALTGRLGFAVFSAVLGMFQFGYNTSVINAPQAVLESFYNESYQARYAEPIPEDLLAFLWPFTVAITAVGGMIGALVAAPWSQKFGRKKGMLVNCVFGIVAAVLMSLSYFGNSFEMIIIGRFIVGINCGLYTGLSPIYNSEIAPLSIRGAVGTLNQLAVTCGILISQLLGLSELLGTDTLWPLLLGLAGVAPVLQLITLPFCPESPRYLLLDKNNEEEAIKALKIFRGSDDVMSEIREMYKEREVQSDEQEIHMCKICNIASLRLPLAVAIVMHLSQQFSGINCIFYYSTDLFINVGLSPDDAKYASLAVGGIMVTMTLVTIPLMDRAGRKVLHLTGLAGMFLFSIVFTITFHFAVQEETSTLQIASVVMALLFVVFFAVGPGSIPWMIVPEFFSHGPRTGAVSIGAMVNWTANFIVGLAFPPLQDALKELVFVPFTILLLFFFIFLIIFLPETKGKSFEDVAESFNHLARKLCKTDINRLDTAKPSPESIREAPGVHNEGYLTFAETDRL